MGFANVRRNLHTDVAYYIGTKWDHVSLLESKFFFLIYLHSSSNLSTLFYTHLMNRLHLSNDLSTLVYICLYLSVTRLHSSTLV